MDKWQAVQSFWESFSIPAYNESVVDTEISMPYITYSAAISGFDDPVSYTVSLWYYSNSWSEISRKASEIETEIGEGGVLVPYAGGSVWIKKGTPFAQRMSDPDARIRRIILNITVEFL